MTTTLLVYSIDAKKRNDITLVHCCLAYREEETNRNDTKQSTGGGKRGDLSPPVPAIKEVVTAGRGVSISRLGRGSVLLIIHKKNRI